VTVAADEPRLARAEPTLELGTSAAAPAAPVPALAAPRGGASRPAAREVTAAEVLAAEIEADPTVADEVALDASEVAAVLDDLTSETPAIASVVVPAPDPSDYAVSDDDRIIVQANETLGHYADWLEIPTSRLRRLNRLRAGTAVGIGRPTRLDFSVVSREQFVQRRLEYHHTLQEEFFAAYEVVGTDNHELERGDTLWYLAEKRYRVPVWLLRQYNPTLDFSALQAGGRLVVPVLASREE
jgi:membrane-bound lytic murein transglycosylase D